MQLLSVQNILVPHLKALKDRLSHLADATFRAREEYEEDYIKFHIAQKRIVDFPTTFQSEVDQMALSVRQKSQHLQAKLTTELTTLTEARRKAENDAEQCFLDNRLLAKEKSISDRLMAELVDKLNESMSIKAQTQIEVFNCMSEIGQIRDQIAQLPIKLEIFAENAREEVKVLQFQYDENCAESIQLSEETKSVVEAIVNHRKEFLKQVGITKAHEQVIKKGNKTEKVRLSSVEMNQQAQQSLHDDKQNDLNELRQTMEREKTETEKQDQSYETEIAKYENLIKDLHAQLGPMTQMRKQEYNDKIENLDIEEQLKNELIDEETTKTENRHCRDQIRTEVACRSANINELLDEQEILIENAKANDNATSMIKEMNEVTLKKEIAAKTKIKNERIKKVNEWKELDSRLSALKAEMKRMTKWANKAIADLKVSLKKVANESKEPRQAIIDIRQKRDETQAMLDLKTEQYEQQEANLERDIELCKESICQNEEAIENLNTETAEKHPIYLNVIKVNNENDTLYNKIKNNFASRQMLHKKLSKQLLKLENDIEMLQEKYTSQKNEKLELMTESTNYLRDKSKNVDELNRDIYSLMIEREQFEFANEKISSLKDIHVDYIDNVLTSNDKVKDQIDFRTDTLSTLAVSLSEARGESEKVNEEEVLIGKEMLKCMENLSKDINDRLHICNGVQNQLDDLLSRVKKNFIGGGGDTATKVHKPSPPPVQTKSVKKLSLPPISTNVHLIQ